MLLPYAESNLLFFFLPLTLHHHPFMHSMDVSNQKKVLGYNSQQRPPCKCLACTPTDPPDAGLASWWGRRNWS